MLLLAERQFDDPVGGGVGPGEARLLVGHGHVVDAQTATLDLASKVASLISMRSRPADLNHATVLLGILFGGIGSLRFCYSLT